MEMQVPLGGFAMRVVELCRSCGHEREAHGEDGRCGESIEMVVDEVGMEMSLPCDCPGWPGR
jgi:hypothetical protein